jgi:hypothetical protein
MLDYGSLKAMAKSIGRPVKNLLALAPINDPFYAGVGARRRDAEWFAAIWADHGAAGFHLRRLHYRLISSTALIRKPDGSAYQNTDDANIIIVHAGKCFGLELKAEHGRVTPAQVDCHERMERAGATVGVAAGIDEAISWLEEHGLLKGQTT